MATLKLPMFTMPRYTWAILIGLSGFQREQKEKEEEEDKEERRGRNGKMEEKKERLERVGGVVECKGGYNLNVYM